MSNNTVADSVAEQPMKKPRTDDDLDLGDLDDAVMEDGPISESAAVDAILSSEIQLKLTLEEMVNQTERSTPTKRVNNAQIRLDNSQCFACFRQN